MAISRRRFLASGAALLAPSLLAALIGCVTTAKYNPIRIGELPEAKIRSLERISQENAGDSLTPQTARPSMSYKASEQLSVMYSHLPHQRIKVFYPNSRNPRLTEEMVLDTTLPLNVGGNDSSLAIMQEILSQVPENAQIAAYDLGQANQDTLSPKTPGNQLSGNDGIKLVQSLSNSGCNYFKIKAVETSKVDRRFKKRDDYVFEVSFNQPEVQAKKIKKDWRYGIETALDGALASTTAFSAHPLWYITPAVVVAEDGLNGLVALIESRRIAPASSILYSNAHIGTNLPRDASLTVHVLDSSAESKSKELILVNLYDDCSRPTGIGVVNTEGAYGIETGANCARFCLSKDQGRFEIDLLRRLSNVTPVLIETTRNRYIDSGGGRNGNNGENNYGGGRGAGSE